jgi:hypothetical protein
MLSLKISGADSNEYLVKAEKLP